MLCDFAADDHISEWRPPVQFSDVLVGHTSRQAGACCLARATSLAILGMCQSRCVTSRPIWQHPQSHHHPCHDFVLYHAANGLLGAPAHVILASCIAFCLAICDVRALLVSEARGIVGDLSALLGTLGHELTGAVASLLACQAFDCAVFVAGVNELVSTLHPVHDLTGALALVFVISALLQAQLHSKFTSQSAVVAGKARSMHTWRCRTRAQRELCATTQSLSSLDLCVHVE